MDPIKLGVNKTTTFLLPMLFPNSTYDEIFSNYFKQAYLGKLDDADELTHNILIELDVENSDGEITVEAFLNDSIQ
jgi:hypothetical protein